VFYWLIEFEYAVLGGSMYLDDHFLDWEKMRLVPFLIDLCVKRNICLDFIYEFVWINPL